MTPERIAELKREAEFPLIAHTGTTAFRAITLEDFEEVMDEIDRLHGTLAAYRENNIAQYNLITTQETELANARYDIAAHEAEGKRLRGLVERLEDIKKVGDMLPAAEVWAIVDEALADAVVPS